MLWWVPVYVKSYVSLDVEMCWNPSGKMLACFENYMHPYGQNIFLNYSKPSPCKWTINLLDQRWYPGEEIQLLTLLTKDLTTKRHYKTFRSHCQSAPFLQTQTTKFRWCQVKPEKNLLSEYTYLHHLHYCQAHPHHYHCFQFVRPRDPISRVTIQDWKIQNWIDKSSTKHKNIKEQFHHKSKFNKVNYIFQSR